MAIKELSGVYRPVTIRREKEDGSPRRRDKRPPPPKEEDARPDPEKRTIDIKA